MSAEEAVTDAVQSPANQNAQAAAEAERLLAELQNDAAPSEDVKKTSEADAETKTKAASTNDLADATSKDTESNEKNSGEGNGNSDRRRDGRDRERERGDHKGRGRGRGDRNGHRNFRDNIKSDVTTQEESSDPDAIRKQVHFYFSDSNLPKDKFLWAETGGKENLPVEIEKIHKFKRMRHFQPFSAVVDALRESTFLELTDNDTKVRRRKPYEATSFEGPEMARSIYAKGFGEEVPSSQFDIEAFFATYGPTNAVRLRRSDQKLFKGSVFVEFETEELAKAFLALDPKPKFKGTELQIMSKKEYCDKKVEDINSGKIKPNGGRFEKNRGEHKDRRGGDNKRKGDGNDDRDWRTRRDDDRKRGFRDDNRRGGRGSNRGGRGGGRSKAPETDDRGVPTIKSSAPKDGGKDDALAKARAAVEADNKTQSDESKKRAREDDGEADSGREAKKIDTKTEA